jgi:hypothetical protein
MALVNERYLELPRRNVLGTFSAMKIFWGSLAVALLLCAGAKDAQGFDKVVVKVQKKQAPPVMGKAVGEGQEAKGSERIHFDLSVQNPSFTDLKELTVNYIVFVERQELGSRPTEPGHIERITGAQKVASLSTKAPLNIVTSDIVLRKQSLTGGYTYPNGGRIKAEDSVAGVWVRVMQGGQVIGEFASPASATKRGWEAKN